MALSAEQVQKLYIAYFGRPADPAGLAFYQNAASADEVATSFAKSTEAAPTVALSTDAFLAAVYQQAFGRAYNASTDGSFWADAINAGKTTKELAMSQILNGASGTDATAVTNKVAVATKFTSAVTNDGKDYSGALAVTAAKNVLTAVTSDAATVTSANAAVTAAVAGLATASAGEGQTFALTALNDTITGTAKDDTITANASTLSALDKIDGGAGVDTLTIAGIDKNGAAASIDMSLPASIKNIEKIVLDSGSSELKQTTLDFSPYKGLDEAVVSFKADKNTTITAAATTKLAIVNTNTDGTETLTVNGGKGDLTVSTGKGNVTIGAATVANNLSSVSIKNGGTVAVNTINDKSGASAATGSSLTTVTADGAANTIVNGNGVTTLNISNGVSTATINSADGTRELTVNLVKTKAGTITDDKATSVKVAQSGADKSEGLTLAAGKATSIGLSATGSTLTVTKITAAEAKTLTATGDKLITIGTIDTGKLTSIDASATTGGLSIGTKLLPGTDFKGGAGADKITLGASTKSTDMGAGNDTVTLDDALGKGGKVDGGAGTDTLKMTSDNAATATATAAFQDTISNFEKLEVTASTTLKTVNMANLDNINDVIISGAAASKLTLDGLKTGAVLTANGDTAEINANVTNTGSTDALTFNVSKDNRAVTADKLTVTNAEILTFKTDNSNKAPNEITHVIKELVADDATTIKVVGDAGLTLTKFEGTKLTTFDASGVTKGAVVYTTAKLANSATLTGGAGNDKLNAAAAVEDDKTITINGGAGNDEITGSNGEKVVSTLNGGAGNDKITGGDGVDIIDGGAGNDQIIGSKGLDQITLGAGEDTFKVVVNTNGNIFSTIKDAQAKDKLEFTDKGNKEVFNDTALSLANTATFQDYLDLAAKYEVKADTTGNGQISWFQFSGDTYVVEDVSLGTAFVNGTDLVVKLTGLVDLSKATNSDSHILTLA